MSLHQNNYVPYQSDGRIGLSAAFIGKSKHYIKHGAVFALDLDPVRVGEQTARLVCDFLNKRRVEMEKPIPVLVCNTEKIKELGLNNICEE